MRWKLWNKAGPTPDANSTTTTLNNNRRARTGTSAASATTTADVTTGTRGSSVPAVEADARTTTSPNTAAAAPAPATAAAGRSSEGTTTGTNATTEDTAATDAAARRRRRRRRRRRTESPVGLPLYSQDPHDDEMSLIKVESHVELGDLDEGDRSDVDDVGDDEVIDDAAVEEDERLAAALRSARRPSASAGGVTTHSATHASRPSLSSLIAASAAGDPSFPLGTGLPGLIPVPSAQRNLIDIPLNAHNAEARRASFSQQHRPSFSSSVSSVASVPIPQPMSSSASTGGRSRSSTLRSIFARAASDSSSAIADTGTGSPGSLAAGDAGRSPYGMGSTARLASQSSSSIRSVNSQSISPPLQHTLVSSSFVFPKSGPTGAQIAFISSRESLGAYGYGNGVAIVPTYGDDMSAVRDSPSGSSAISPTSSPLAVPSSGTRTRGTRASSVSSQMSQISLVAAPSPLAKSSSVPCGFDAIGSGASRPGTDERSAAESSVVDLDDHSTTPILSYEETLHQDQFSQSHPTTNYEAGRELSASTPLASLDSPSHSANATPVHTPRSRSPAFGTVASSRGELALQTTPKKLASGAPQLPPLDLPSEPFGAAAALRVDVTAPTPITPIATELPRVVTR